MIENITFSGGGTRAIAFLGVYKYLEENGYITGIKRISGTSAGAMVALLVALGIPYKNCHQILLETDITKLIDNSNIMRNVFRLLFKYGYYSFDEVVKWFSKFLDNNGVPSKRLTFRYIKEKYNRELIITGTNLNDHKVMYFCAANSPELNVLEAIKCSACIPFIFEPTTIDGKIIVDGGLLNNYPINIFKYSDPEFTRTYGFHLYSSHQNFMEIANIIEFVDCIIQMVVFSTQKTRNKLIHRNTVEIDIADFKATEFGINNERINKLVDIGYSHTKDYFTKDIRFIHS